MNTLNPYSKLKSSTKLNPLLLLTSIFVGINLYSTTLYASTSVASLIQTTPSHTTDFTPPGERHFYVRMANLSDKEATISFKKGAGNVFLEPTLIKDTKIGPHVTTQKYEVHIVPLEPTATFDIVFKGKAECAFTVGYYAPGNPKISMIGPGCAGGGYSLVEKDTLDLYIRNINK